MAWLEVYFRSKLHFHPSSHLATIDMGQKLDWVGVPFSGGSWVHIEHNVALAEAYLYAKWYLDPSSRLATVGMGRKLGAVPPFRGRGAGSHLAQCGLGRDLPPYQVAS